MGPEEDTQDVKIDVQNVANRKKINALNPEGGGDDNNNGGKD